MNPLQAFILGLVQGITEFLPISSSAHLVLFPVFLGWDVQSIEFDLALHLGTALAVLLFFRADWLKMFNSLKNDFVAEPKSLFSINKLRRESRLLLILILVTIPVGILGLLFEDIITNIFRSPIHIAIIMIVVSFFMWFSEIYTRKLKSHSEVENMNFMNAFIISMSQFISLFPGASRSGITMATGLFRGLSRSEAAKFSFLLATPITLGAVAVKLPDILLFEAESLGVVLIGFFTSLISAVLVIKWLLEFLRKQSFMVFILYRIILGVFIIFTFLN